MLIDLLKDNPQPLPEILHSFKDERYRNVQIEDVIDVSRFASWIAYGKDQLLFVTDEGREMLAAGSDILRMRRQVHRLIELRNMMFFKKIPKCSDSSM